MAAKSGRPLDPALTTALMNSTLDLLAEHGLAKVNADAVCVRARSGKAAVYRRWSSIPVLIADALRNCQLIPEVADTGTLRSDLISLMDPWMRPLTRCELAAASLLGHAGRNSELGKALEEAVARPLLVAIDQISAAHGRRGPTVSELQVTMLGIVVQSLWWYRYTTHHQGATAAELAELVDLVLLPLASST